MKDALAEQYRTGANLAARIGLHARFSVSPVRFPHWVVDQLALGRGARVLEVGCGTGELWAANAGRLPAGLRLTLTDLSAGMLEEAGATLERAGVAAERRQADAVDLPFADGSFDVVVADHMLYHVPDLRRALGELRRVLAPGGLVAAATNGAGHLRELKELVGRHAGGLRGAGVPLVFSLENGAAELGALFGAVELRRFEDALVVDEAEPLVAYVASMWTWQGAVDLDGLRAEAEQLIARDGAIRIAKDSGLFLARA